MANSSPCDHRQWREQGSLQKREMAQPNEEEQKQKMKGLQVLLHGVLSHFRESTVDSRPFFGVLSFCVLQI